MSNIQGYIEKTREQLRHHQRECIRLYAKIRKAMRKAPLSVSDHAVLRYLERVKGIDIDAVREEITTPQLLDYYHQLGDGEFPTGEGTIRCVIQKGTIVTVLK